MRRRGHTGAQGETESTQDNEANFCESSLCDVRLSTDPKQQCRFILIGGDEAAKNDACRFILRTAQTQPFQRAYNQSCYMKEKCVRGRHVCVVKSLSYWLEHLASCWFISTGVKTIQKEMEHCISLVFPGPHAFLLVIRDGSDTRTEHYLLQAISSVFGVEAVDYSIVLYVKGSGECVLENSTNPSVSMCEGRYHLLENTDESVQKLFMKVENVVNKKISKFFIPSSYEIFMKVKFESWEKKRIDLLTDSKDKLEEMKRMQDRQREAEQATESDLIQWSSNDRLHPDL
ncbi:GTPase IMAP family member 2-like isoform X2 [Ictalurus furcatus]|uniref:GTPase IMAP family member 2-like isoform X2 n=1 Tax=Ictalurus furcatus TaxID=66913 RepID=UPI002350B026|nr:GTPase IMAP family member 2-like isoform X2 [Ictalurus furcatus]XP_053504689.1 GTPase IMAP family member 2-like isoform X2 [Ictalurus furcatus]XP_053504690.1 GTPase IMAP family member 2-like isoform X2 [Ictalurus furcatus]